MTALLNPPVPSSALPRLRWHQLYGSAAALALAEATRADRRLYVVIADAARELDRLTAEVRFFAGAALPLLRLPDWEGLPYDLFSPHPDIVSERLKTLFELPQVSHGCLIVAADTLLQRMRQVPGLVDLRIQQPFDYPTLQIAVDRTSAWRRPATRASARS